MNAMRVIAVAVVVAVGSDRAPAQERDLSGEVRTAFAAKCVGCHGAELPKPKGRFGHVLDLRRVAGNPEMVIPGRPDESELWTLIRRDEMPPTDSPHGPLTGAEKASVRDWIAAGAPDAAPTSGAVEAPTAISQPVQPPALADRAVRWMGKLHLVVLHFPIALVIAAGLGELLTALRGSRTPAPAVAYCLGVAAITVVPTVIFGWFYALGGNGVGSPQLLTAHRWLGTFTGVWIIGAALCASCDARRGERGWSVRVALAVGIPLVVLVGHLGGLMAHGDDFYEW